MSTFSAPRRRSGWIRAAAGALGIDIVDMLEVRKPEDIAPAFAALTGGAQVLYVCGDSLTNTFHARINTLALGARLLTIQTNRDSLDGGGFISYGVNIADLYRRAGDYVDKILRARSRPNCRSSSRPSSRWSSTSRSRRRSG